MKDWQNIILAYAMEKCSQFGSKVFDIFWMYTSQIGSDKLRGSPISSFWSCDSDLCIFAANFANEWKLINLCNF